MLKNLAQVLFLVGLPVLSIFIWEKAKSVSLFGSDQVSTTHHMVLKEMQSMGKIELAKFSFRDVVEQHITRDFLPDPHAILIVQGEAIGCIDLTKISQSDIILLPDTLVLTLPEPEVCSHKIDHSQSKIYKTDFAFRNEALLLDEAYKKAEDQMLASAIEAGIIDQTKANAQLVLAPLIAKLSGKKVLVKYRIQGNLKKLN
jgi:Protein of unknown function (DUF4230)